MEKLLSICIPTFNRSHLLDQQLAWLAQEIQPFGDECEVIISDNCSDDDTAAVIQKWRSAFNQTQFRSNRNAENVGWMHNFLYCVNAASGRYTWIIGDDDRIYQGALAYVIETLKSRLDLSLLYLNFSDYNPETKTVRAAHWFDPSLKISGEGQTVFQQYMQDNIGSVIFISATIFRTQFAREAQQIWQDAMNNWAGLAFWNGYCATKGNVLVSSENYLECTLGVSYWQKDPKAWFKILHWDIPEVYIKLLQVGYSEQFCRQMILKIVKDDLNPRSLATNLKYYLWCFLKYPLWSAKVVAVFLNCMRIVIWPRPLTKRAVKYFLIGSSVFSMLLSFSSNF